MHKEKLKFKVMLRITVLNSVNIEGPLNDLSYRKVPKFSDARNFAIIHLKFKQRGQN